MTTTYYVAADTYTMGDVNGHRQRVWCGRVKAIVEADGYSQAITRGKDVIEAGLQSGYAACNYGCMATQDAEALGDAEVYQRMRTIA